MPTRTLAMTQAVRPASSADQVPNPVDVDLSAVIMAAKLGRTRRDAQEDTCSVFAAALYDVLRRRGVPCQLWTATPSAPGFPKWYHSVVKVGGRYYDSMGEFSEAAYRSRARIHPKVILDIRYARDKRALLYEEEFEEMYAFYGRVLDKTMSSLDSGKPTDVRAGDAWTMEAEEMGSVPGP